MATVTILVLAMKAWEVRRAVVASFVNGMWRL
jgi:hypothetical protein